jgi:hypothetical protein
VRRYRSRDPCLERHAFRSLLVGKNAGSFSSACADVDGPRRTRRGRKYWRRQTLRHWGGLARKPADTQRGR